jgi:hypothetical protein
MDYRNSAMPRVTDKSNCNLAVLISNGINSLPVTPCKTNLQFLTVKGNQIKVSSAYELKVYANAEITWAKIRSVT